MILIVVFNIIKHNKYYNNAFTWTSFENCFSLNIFIPYFFLNNVLNYKADIFKQSSCSFYFPILVKLKKF